MQHQLCLLFLVHNDMSSYTPMWSYQLIMTECSAAPEHMLDDTRHLTWLSKRQAHHARVQPALACIQKDFVLSPSATCMGCLPRLTQSSGQISYSNFVQFTLQVCCDLPLVVFRQMPSATTGSHALAHAHLTGPPAALFLMGTPLTECRRVTGHFLPCCR